MKPEFERADPAALAVFDPRTKACTMNCGAHRADPRDKKERQFLCDDCWSIPVAQQLTAWEGLE